VGGIGLDAQWSDDFHHALHSVITGERNGCLVDFGSIGDLAKVFEKSFVYTGTRSQFRQRRHGRPPVEVSAHRFLVYIQNHDQLGNRARGERLCHLIGRSWPRPSC
jgi:maltooligosyltrehalose trehalohydrolase